MIQEHLDLYRRQDRAGRNYFEDNSLAISQELKHFYKKTGFERVKSHRDAVYEYFTAIYHSKSFYHKRKEAHSSTDKVFKEVLMISEYQKTNPCISGESIHRGFFASDTKCVNFANQNYLVGTHPSKKETLIWVKANTDWIFAFSAKIPESSHQDAYEFNKVLFNNCQLLAIGTACFDDMIVPDDASDPDTAT